MSTVVYSGGSNITHPSQEVPAGHTAMRLSHSFWEHVAKQSDGCWVWQRATIPNGYGRLRWQGRKVLAHRFAAYLHGMINHPSANGVLVLHKCDNRLCCNPEHLFLGSHADNTRDAVVKGRQFLPDNRGARSANAKLSPSDVIVIRGAYSAGGVSQQQLASQYGVHQMTISKVVRGSSYK